LFIFSDEFGDGNCSTPIVIVVIWYLFDINEGIQMVTYEIIKNLITIETLEDNP
jgi:hypothetical protein